MTHRLLGLCGSLRCASTNALHLREACRLYAPAEWEESDLRLPLCGGDLEADAGIPDAVARLATRIAAADAVVIATPEYNKALSGVLKSALGWISRVKGARGGGTSRSRSVRRRRGAAAVIGPSFRCGWRWWRSSRGCWQGRR